MPPRSSTQVIESGEYLERNFDPNTLTIAHLLSIFTFHQIKYPVPHNKSKLVEAFNEQVKPRAEQFKRERLSREGSIASSHGITDGMTGRSLSEDEHPVEDLSRPLRRSRRLSKPPESVVAESPKRRRSSAEPTLSRIPTSRLLELTEPTVLEESEPEEVEEPVKKVGRTRKSVLSPRTQARKMSHPDETEGWSDNNIFQSGAESSSPARPLPKTKGSVTTRRSSRRVRASFSAPPQIPSSSPFKAPFASEFEPKILLPKSSQQPRVGLSGLISAPVKTEPRSSSPIPESEVHDEEDAEYSDIITDFNEFQVLNDGVSRALAQSNLVRTTTTTTSHSSILRFAAYGLILAISIITYSYKSKSITIGYCDSGKDTNDIIELRKLSLNASEECLRREEGSTCDQPPVFTFLEPLTCTPCPVHASCIPTNVTCYPSFIAQAHPMARFPILPSLLNGLPGFGPVAFPLRCVEDEARKRRIGSIGAILRHRLALLRGEKLCSGQGMSSGLNMHEAVRWGTTVDLIHDDVLRRLRNIPKRRGRLDEFDKIFKEAILNLEQYGDVSVYTDPTTRQQYVASKSIELSVWCEAKLNAQEKWGEWKGYILGGLTIIVVTLRLRKRRTSERAESNRVVELVQVALDTLRNQEMAHHIDPVTTPYSQLSSIQLRDLILQEEHSIPARRRLWDKVEKIVEGNANVRAIMSELEGGDVGRVWQWVGSTGITTRSP